MVLASRVFASSRWNLKLVLGLPYQDIESMVSSRISQMLYQVAILLVAVTVFSYQKTCHDCHLKLKLLEAVPNCARSYLSLVLLMEKIVCY